jgi:hypothetical protein
MGGVKDGEFRFCNDQCHYHAYLKTAADEIPAGTIEQEVMRVHAGPCPECQGPGPVDMHTAHKVWSLLLLTSWNSEPWVCCRRCGVKKQAMGATFSLLAGWWGFPWGLIMTPVQIVRNVAGMLKGESAGPSDALRQLIMVSLAEQLLQEPGQSDQTGPGKVAV